MNKINLKIEIRNNKTNEITSDVWINWEYNDYWWEEGNASCDCNRKLFFYRFKGIELEDKEVPCGDGEFSVRLSNNDTGELLYHEY